MAYADRTDLARHGVSTQVLARIPTGEQDEALDVMSAVADDYLGERFTLPLTAWSRSLRMHVAAMAAYELMSVRGYNVDSSDKILKMRFDTAVAWLREMADEVVCLTTPAPFYAVGQHYRDFRQVDDADVVGSVRRVVRIAMFVHAHGPRFPPTKCGLWCAAQVVAGLPDIPAVVRDVVAMVHIPSVVQAVHAAPNDDDEPDELLLLAGAAWRNAEGGLRRLMLDARVLLHYPGNDAEAETVLRSIKRNAADACEAYAGALGATAA